MSKTPNRIISIEIKQSGILLITSKGVAGIYETPCFLLEIYEKLQNRYVFGKPDNEFFNFEDPKGAWTLLDDFFHKTDFLNNVSLKEFEEYRSRYNIALEFKKGEIIQEHDVPLSEIDVLTFKRFSNELDEWRIFDKESFDNAIFRPDVFRYYSCRTMIDFVFSLIHYYIFNGYKIRLCSHCGKLFATQNLKEKYCTRKSPFPEYEKYSCKQAIKPIKDMLEKKRHSEDERLRLRAKEYGVSSKYNEIWNNFAKTASDYKKQIKHGASIELLTEYKNFLFDSENVRPKYARIKDW